MLREEQNRLLKGLINHLDLKTNVDAGGIMRTPADTYTCEERFNLEWNSFFQDYPQIIGLSGDLSEPNSFFTIEDFGSPIIATRDADGKFKAFANVCTHRGAVVENEKRGIKSKFSCPSTMIFFNFRATNSLSCFIFISVSKLGHIFEKSDLRSISDLPR